MNIIDVFIVGSGPAGCTAAIYAARAGLRTTMVLGPLPGGLMTTTNLVENFPGFISIPGKELMEKMQNHAGYYGAKILSGSVENIIKSGKLFEIIMMDGTKFVTGTIILATGAQHKKLELVSEEYYENKGVSYCAICDGFFFKNQVVAVIGGGNSATEEAIYLSTMAKKVYLIHRRDSLRSEKILQNRLFSIKNVEILWNTVVEEFLGDGEELQGIKIRNTVTNLSGELSISAAFIAIGYEPYNALGKDFANITPGGYLENLGYGKTNTSGFFVAGDVHDMHNKQAITAAGYGCEAALSAIRYLQDINE